jgi:hypothetical protein
MILFRIIRNLIKLAMNLLWLPFNLIGRNLFGLIIVIGVIAFFVMLNSKESAMDEPELTIPSQTVQTGQPAGATPPAPPPVMQDKNAPPIIIDPVKKVEDGNSSFAQDMLKLMSSSERAYYSQVFYWTMNNAAGGKTIRWANNNTYGNITPQAIFLNGKGHACRRFTEVLKAKDTKQNIRGLACQRGGGAWCKLGPNSTPACGLGKASDFWGGITRSLGL